MGKVHERIDTKLAGWIGRQSLFFVATAPGNGGHVNVSPKGPIGSFRILDERTVEYDDHVGSGAETIAHLRDNGRICVMFCAFDGAPNIVRLHGAGRAIHPGDPGFDEALAVFGEAGASRRPQARSVIVVDVARVADSCGFSVPKMALVQERDFLDSLAKTRGPEKLVQYRAQRNATSLDGLPALPA
jgi:Pyridoxamine 5'-phosphate oxidase